MLQVHAVLHLEAVSWSVFYIAVIDVMSGLPLHRRTVLPRLPGSEAWSGIWTMRPLFGS